MTAARCHRILTYIAIGFGVTNLLSWLFLDLRELLVYFDPWMAVGAMRPAFVLGLPALALLAPIDAASRAPLAQTLWLVGVTTALMVFEALWLVLLAVAAFFRGPDWNFYWPWEERTPKIVPSNLVNLSDYVWRYLLDAGAPAHPLLRELPGIVLLAVHLLLLPCAACWLVRRVWPGAQAWRVFASFVVIQLLMLLPMKMAAHAGLNLKYFVAFTDPWINV